MGGLLKKVSKFMSELFTMYQSGIPYGTVSAVMLFKNASVSMKIYIND